MKPKVESHKELIYFELIVLVFVFGLLATFTSTSMTGYLSVDMIKQNVDLTIDHCQDFIFTSSSEDEFSLNSLGLSGKVIGSGVVEVYLENGQGQELLVYTNFHN